MNILKVLTKNRLTGNFGEDAAAKFLKRNGYRILERNYVAKGNEIDIIAKSKDTLIFVEVKTRTLGRGILNESRPAAAVNYEKQRKIIDTAGWYLASREYSGLLKGLHIRLDVIEVYVSQNGTKRKTENIVHIEGAFRRDYEIYKYTGSKRTRR